MGKTSHILKACHTAYELKYHFVFVVKYRKGIFFTEKIVLFVKECIEEIGKRYYFEIGEIATDGNHLHLFLQAAPRYSPAQIAQTIKSISAKELFKKFPEIKQELWGGHFWATGYYVGSVGGEKTETVIRKYIQNQGKETGHGNFEQLRLF